MPGTPLLRRGPDELQVGLDPGRAVLLRGAGPARLLTGLDGRHDHPALHALGGAVGVSTAEVDAVLASLHAAGLLEPAVTTARAGVRVVGLGPLGQQVATLLLAAGVDVYAADLVPDRSTRPPPPDPDVGPPTAAGRLVLVDHWSKPELDLALTVLVPDTVEVDRVLPETLLRSDQPHLLLRSTGTTVTVGPLVLPGRTPCVRCCDLARRDADPAWPRLLPQLTRLRPPPGGVLTAWGAAVTAAQVLALLAGEVPESAGGTLELSSPDHLTRRRPWPLHPACGCAWARTTEWAP